MGMIKKSYRLSIYLKIFRLGCSMHLEENHFSLRSKHSAAFLVIIFLSLVTLVPISDAFSGTIHKGINEEALGFLTQDVYHETLDEHLYVDTALQFAAFFHFDSCSFSDSKVVINLEYVRALNALNPDAPDLEDAPDAFGQILHVIQDFYPHANWVEMGKTNLVEPGLSFWPTAFDPFSTLDGTIVLQGEELPPGYSAVLNGKIPTVTTPAGEELPGLITGATYFFDDCIDELTLNHWDDNFTPGTLPFDSDPGEPGYNTGLNKDGPSRVGYTEARTLAVKQTVHEFCRLGELVFDRYQTRGVDYLFANWVADGAAATMACPNIDTLAPGITIIGDNPLEIPWGEPYSDPGATAMDPHLDGDVSSKIVVNSLGIDTFSEGSYEVYYDVTDNSGNAAVTKVRTVNVVYTPPPPGTEYTAIKDGPWLSHSTWKFLTVPNPNFPAGSTIDLRAHTVDISAAMKVTMGGRLKSGDVNNFGEIEVAAGGFVEAQINNFGTIKNYGEFRNCSFFSCEGVNHGLLLNEVGSTFNGGVVNDGIIIAKGLWKATLVNNPGAVFTNEYKSLDCGPSFRPEPCSYFIGLTNNGTIENIGDILVDFTSNNNLGGIINNNGNFYIKNEYRIAFEEIFTNYGQINNQEDAVFSINHIAGMINRGNIINEGLFQGFLQCFFFNEGTFENNKSIDLAGFCWMENKANGTFTNNPDANVKAPFFS